MSDVPQSESPRTYRHEVWSYPVILAYSLKTANVSNTKAIWAIVCYWKYGILNIQRWKLGFPYFQSCAVVQVASVYDTMTFWTAKTTLAIGADMAIELHSPLNGNIQLVHEESCLASWTPLRRLRPKKQSWTLSKLHASTVVVLKNCSEIVPHRIDRLNGLDIFQKAQRDDKLSQLRANRHAAWEGMCPNTARRYRTNPLLYIKRRTAWVGPRKRQNDQSHAVVSRSKSCKRQKQEVGSMNRSLEIGLSIPSSCRTKDELQEGRK